MKRLIALTLLSLFLIALGGCHAHTNHDVRPVEPTGG
jgi:hypothetical protein